MLGRSALVAAAIAVGGCVGVAPAMAGGGVFSVGCDYLPSAKRFQKIDPIVNYWQDDDGDPRTPRSPTPPRSAHLHVFRGNHLIAPDSTFAYLRSATSTETGCSRNTDVDKPGSGDLSSYWAPTLMREDTTVGGETTYTPVPVTRINTYYEAPHANYEAIQPFPDGLKMIARDPVYEAANRDEVPGDMLPSPLGARLVCVPGELRELPNGAVQCIDDDPLDGNTPGIRLSVKFPSCLKDGYEPELVVRASEHDRDDSAAVAYPIQSGSKWVCPAGFGTPIPQIFIQFGWQSSGGPNFFMSNHLPGEHNHTDKWHADFFNGWDSGVLETLVANCLRKKLVCGAGNGEPPAPPGSDVYLDTDPEPCPTGCTSTASPIAHWTLDELVGTTAFDRGLGAHHGTYSGRYELGAPPLRPAAAGDPGDRSALFRDAEPGQTGDPPLRADQTSGRVVVSDSPSLRPGSGAWTIEGWARFPDQAQTAILYSKRPSTGDQQLVLFLGKLDDSGSFAGRKLCLILQQQATMQRNTCTERDVADGAVHHFAARVNPLDADGHNRLTLYVDGRPVQDRVTTWSAGPWPSISTTAPVQIGGNSDLEATGLGPVSLDGELDDLHLYTGLRSSAEIKADYQAGLGTAP